MTTKKIDDMIITYRDDKETRDAVFEKIISWFVKMKCFDGDDVMQRDEPNLNSPILLGDLADDIIEFNVDYKEEDE